MKKYILPVALCMLLGFSSCDDSLDLNPKDKVSEADYFKTAEDLPRIVAVVKRGVISILGTGKRTFRIKILGVLLERRPVAEVFTREVYTYIVNTALYPTAEAAGRGVTCDASTRFSPVLTVVPTRLP